ncbi:MAG: uroporphyrinogen-III synthase [Mobiluncus porci]|uniref:Uroporphyrinogen-III synthase n=1 Tax=Mobiluncus porci TaxID=2652278 RepID=A0A7K0K0X6_9ACTO|nr:MULTISPECIES: uroporphyrinogen-III synthase [Mobiluncus]MCI6583511.1 uroporphyrinogen-III synthase [Mobiluncus sp.]MDD7540889.1 uroporphyrinogen-III synthase [Mobiluncus porci]MDY5748918.1 uroporphyrinogen-III synthase [Mobiluncus porci]MST49146.1 uroporphyrinogen-III synthase [Mobiluncus porci]
MKPKLLVPRVPSDILASELAEAGLPVVCAPVTEKRPTPSEDWFDPMQRLQDGEYTWVVISSVATAAFLDEHYDLADLFREVQVAAVGSATAQSLENRGGHVDLVGPDPASAASLVEVFPRGSGNVLLPGAVGAAPTLAEGLNRLGYDVERLKLYESVALPELPLEWAEALAIGEPTFVLITAGSVAQAAHRMFTQTGVKLWPVPIAFGKSSAKVLSELGWPAATVCETTDTEGVMAAYDEVMKSLES